ncbi:MAG: selenocysteine-specific translation elongation factor [Acidobacteria bacterium]|nr:selenocysteine-specific translation elongation factor [Acidobacteriota bacterium]
MARVIVGTAGHIDHGKTRLVEALTGIDCDRWAQEKARGITIDLGFAHLEDGDLQVGFIDVPGHQRFLHNALAGLGGVRVLLLVVAADEGVKPQTREHVDIASLLGIPAALVALTKRDLVSDDLLELAELEVSELLAAGPLAGAPVVAVSSKTGAGLDELRTRLLELARAQALAGDADGSPTRLPLDRAFHLKGAGVVVTGTLTSGSAAQGDQLEIQPGGAAVRVRSVQVHGEPRERGLAGERTSLQLAGSDLDQLHRGVFLTTPGAFGSSRQLLCRCRLLPDAPKPVRGFVPVRVHCYASEIVGKMRPLEPATLEPGAEGLVEIRLSQPVTAIRGDAVILRRPSPAATLGGGRILDPAWRRRRGRALTAALEALSGNLDSALRQWVLEAGEAGVSAEELARRLGRPATEVRGLLETLAAAGHLLAVPGASPPRWLSPAVLRRLRDRAAEILKNYFRDQRLARGLPKAELIQRLLSPRGRSLAATYVGWLEAAGILGVDGDLVTLPGRQAQLTSEESRLAREVVAAFEAAGLTPPSPAEVARTLGAKPQILDGVVRYLVEQGKLLKLPSGLVLATASVERVVGEMRRGGWQRFEVGRFKDHFGLSRKWAIPLLEHLDSTGVTRRVGDERLLVGAG